MNTKLLFSICIILSFNCISQNYEKYQVNFINYKPSIKDSSAVLNKIKIHKGMKISSIYFGGNFSNDSVKIYNNNVLVLDTVLNTNLSTEMSGVSYKMKSSEQNLITLKIEESTIAFAYDNRFLFLIIERKNNIISLNYSNYPPFYH